MCVCVVCVCWAGSNDYRFCSINAHKWEVMVLRAKVMSTFSIIIIIIAIISL